MTTIVGIDPGITGALAVFSNGSLSCVEDMPVLDGQADGSQIAVFLSEHMPDWVVVEQVQPMPRNGSIASFSLGKNYGIVLGVATSMGYPLTKMRPVAWKQKNGLLKKPKAASRLLASELWPQHAHMFRRVKDDGRAEAALIARAHSFNLVHLHAVETVQ